MKINCKKHKWILVFLLLLSFSSSRLYAQNTDSTKIKLCHNYYKLNRVQKDVAQFYLMSIQMSLNGMVTMYRSRPQLVGIGKDGELYSFERYKTLYNDAKENKEDFDVNLFYADYLRTSNNGEILLAYTLLEPNWDDAPEVKRYIDRIDFGVEKRADELEIIRKIHHPQRVKKLNRKFVFFYMNDYD